MKYEETQEDFVSRIFFFSKQLRVARTNLSLLTKADWRIHFVLAGHSYRLLRTGNITLLYSIRLRSACLVGFLTYSSTTRLYRGRAPRPVCVPHTRQRGDHDFCLSRSHYTDTDPISRERATTARIEPRTSSHLPTELPRPPISRRLHLLVVWFKDHVTWFLASAILLCSL